MNPLDDLISSSARVPGVTPDGLGKGRAELDAAIAGASARQMAARQPRGHASRKATTRWWGGARGKAIVGVAGLTAAAAAVALTVVVLPSSSIPSKTAPKAAPAPKATVQAKPKATVDLGAPVSVKSVTYNFDTTTSSTSAATVLDSAATAIGERAGPGTEPNVDWSAPYYHTVQVTTCRSGTSTNNTWQTRTDDGVGLNTGSCAGPGAGGMFSISAGFADFYGLGNQPLTEKQVDELPTDPNKLWPILEGFDNDALTSDPASPHSNASTMFQSIWNLITSEPLSPAFREALLEDTAKIPGVSVEGEYTDSLGRTGTVLHIGMWTMAIDTTNGQILAMTSSAIPGIPLCNGKPPAHGMCQGGASTTVYVSANLVTSVPKSVASMIAYSKAHEPKVWVAPAPTPKL
jgi:hypothetical protein